MRHSGMAADLAMFKSDEEKNTVRSSREPVGSYNTGYFLHPATVLIPLCILLLAQKSCILVLNPQLKVVITEEIRNTLAQKITTLTMHIQIKMSELTAATSQAGRRTRQKNIDKMKGELAEAQEAWNRSNVEEAPKRPSSPLSKCPNEVQDPGTGSRALTLMSDGLTTHTEPNPNVSALVPQAQVVAHDFMYPNKDRGGIEESEQAQETPSLAEVGQSLMTDTPRAVSRSILETERQASMVIANLDHAISGSPQDPHLQDSQHPAHSRVEGYISSAQSIWKPELLKLLSPVGIADEGPKNSGSAGDERQSVEKGPKHPIATEEASDVLKGYEQVLPKPLSPVQTVDKSPKHSAPTADSQAAGEGPEHPVPIEHTSDMRKDDEKQAADGIATESPASELIPNACEDKMKPAPVEHLQQTPLGVMATATVLMTMDNPTLEEVKTEEAKMEEMQMLEQEGNVKQQDDGQAITLSDGQLRANSTGKRPRDPDSSGRLIDLKCENIRLTCFEEGSNEQKKTKKLKSQKSRGAKATDEIQNLDDDDFIVKDNVVDPNAEYVEVDGSKDEDEDEDNKEKLITKLRWKPKEKYSWKESAQKAMTKKWKEKGLEAWKNWCLNPVKNPIPANIRSKARSVSEYCPELATTCYDLSLQILTSEVGTTQCLAHSFSQDWMQNDQIGCIKGYQATGIPQQAVAAKKDPGKGFLHCGCRINTALMELYFYKTGKIPCEKTNPDGTPVEVPIVESWCGSQLMPRHRVLIFKQIAEEMAWSLDCIWQRRENDQGQWIVPISAIERQKTHLARQITRIKWLEAREKVEKAQAAQMDIDG
ncbi:hypothetical protein GYMLUDRAFT_60170 [Collybiopsis luxurians FD-317 M1]|uniref:Uncharacterized protein n=1 Tax=Collybiopsis luxurians FD-317 M1 TaxID=944289 RepID=A0A0D0CL37_9AGAR|nr:hypothetical protein GYMLUDRAFT_60170 [Collybiopsis luxurians FD-317 M1]